MRQLAMVLLLALACSPGLLAQEQVACFEDPAREARYRELIHTLRCMKCQNQSIAESPIDQAADLRRQTCELMTEGRNESEIRDYMAARYGDFINYQPPLKPTTWLLWAGPVLLLAGGVFIFARILRARMNQPLDEDLS